MEQEWNPKQKKSVWKLRVYTKNYQKAVGCKKELISAIQNHLKDFREKKQYYDEHPEIVEKILVDGTKKAGTIAKKKMKDIRKSMEIDYFENIEEKEE